MLSSEIIVHSSTNQSHSSPDYQLCQRRNKNIVFDFKLATILLKSDREDDNNIATYVAGCVEGDGVSALHLSIVEVTRLFRTTEDHAHAYSQFRPSVCAASTSMYTLWCINSLYVQLQSTIFICYLEASTESYSIPAL